MDGEQERMDPEEASWVFLRTYKAVLEEFRRFYLDEPGAREIVGMELHRDADGAWTVHTEVELERDCDHCGATRVSHYLDEVEMLNVIRRGVERSRGGL